MKQKFFFVFFFYFSAAIFAQDSSFYFYKGYNYGSQAMYNPGALMLNGGFDILQSATHSRDVRTIILGTGIRNVWNNIKDPFPKIRQYGTKRFIGNEVFPTSFKIENAQWFPNYTLHLIGGGMDSRMLLEWYRYYNFPYPTAMALLSTAAYHIINEGAENDKFIGPNVDPIADLYIFDLGGVILFSFDGVAKFFSETLNLTAWPVQPAYNPTHHTLENNGQYYVMRYPLSFWKSTSLFYHFGDNGMLGLSFLQNNGESISASVGFATRELRTVDVRNGTRTVTVSLGYIAGIFYDRNNSLLASLFVSNRINEKIKFNMYPGIIDFGGFSPGVFASIGNGGQFIAGITMKYSPIGIAYRDSK